MEGILGKRIYNSGYNCFSLLIRKVSINMELIKNSPGLHTSVIKSIKIVPELCFSPQCDQ